MDPYRRTTARALRAAVLRRAGKQAWKPRSFRVEVGGCAIVIPLDEAAEAKVVGSQFEPKSTLPDPQWDDKPPKKVKLAW